MGYDAPHQVQAASNQAQKKNLRVNGIYKAYPDPW